MKLPKNYYLNESVVDIAKDLIGKVLITRINNIATAGIITETEAYNGIYDKACHAYNGRITERNKVLYETGGISYVYLCYGMHYLFNVVTNKKNIPEAVLIRAIKPIEGLTTIFKRISKQSLTNNIFSGPGKVTKALGIDKRLNTQALTGNQIWIEDKSIKINYQHLSVGPRIGVDYAQEDALLPYRFYINPKLTDEVFIK